MKGKISKVSSMLLVVCMLLSIMPMNVLATPMDEATAAYMNFLREGSYETYINGLDLEDRVQYEYQYDIKDMNKDGIPELFFGIAPSVMADFIEDVVVFEYDTNTKGIILAGRVENKTAALQLVYYSDSTNTIYHTSTHFNGPTARNRIDFYSLSDNQLVLAFQIIDDHSAGYFLAKDGKEIKLSYEEFKTYCDSERDKFDWKSISDMGTFNDVPENQYYFDAVEWAVNKGITTGLTADVFGPEVSCTRGEIVTFLWRAMGKPAPGSTECPFKDISADSYYYDAVLWAVEEGITKGWTATAFNPYMPCTRGQIVTFLWRAMNEPTPTGSSHPFKDISSYQYYYIPVLWAVEEDVTTGLTATQFAPEIPCTRGQIVTFLYRALAK